MKRKENIKFMKWSLVFLFLLSFTASGCKCSQMVPPGYLGMVMTRSGLTGKILQPGKHNMYQWDKLVLVEFKEVMRAIKLNILCADDLNFKFSLKIRARLKAKSGRELMAVFNRKGTNKKNVLTFEELYNTYVKPTAKSIAREVVSSYQTVQIRESRAAIQKAIHNKLRIALKGTPMEVPFVRASNFDYPDVITRAVERRREKEIKLKEEKARQAIELLKMQNRKRIALLRRQVIALEAKAQSERIKIIGAALTNKYLRLRELDNNEILYKRVAPGDKVIITGGNSRGLLPTFDLSRTTRRKRRKSKKRLRKSPAISVGGKRIR